jgi:transcriptional regulator with PAS, ATPase and Fis domain
MSVNCAAPAQQVEAEMFGYVKGAFAGADATKIGLFEATNGGTVFLDEIGSMPLETQTKLLRVLQDRKICKVGGLDHVQVDVRVIAASSEKLEPLTAQGRFREDLYHRLSVISMDIPPLRNRTEDILPLVGHMMRHILGPAAELPAINSETQNILIHYNWPGNVRELEKAIQQALSCMQNGSIGKDALPAEIVNKVEERIKSGATVSRNEQFKGKSLKAFLQGKQLEILHRTTESVSGDKGKPVDELGASLASLYRKRASD